MHSLTWAFTAAIAKLRAILNILKQCGFQWNFKAFHLDLDCLLLFVGLVWCFMSLSTDMVMSRQSVHLTTLFPGQAWLSVLPVLCAHTFACNWQQPFLNQLKGGEWPKKLFHDQSPWKYGTRVESNHDPWICSQALNNLQSDTLPTALRVPVMMMILMRMMMMMVNNNNVHWTNVYLSLFYRSTTSRRF